MGKCAEEILEDFRANEYLGGEVITPNGASKTCVIPSGTNTVVITANGGDVYYHVNAVGNASNASPGFVAQGQHWIMRLRNMTSLKVWATGATVKAHIEYMRS